MKTQAQQLDLMLKKRQKKDRGNLRFVAITSGKGGVGKSTISANLAYTLWSQGYKVAIMDADIGLANLDVMFGVKNEKNILHMLKGQATLKEVLVEIEEGLYLVPGESGEEILKYSGELMMEHFNDESTFMDGLDYMIIDTGAGIGESIQMFLNASDDVIVVTVPDPAAITDAYAMIKITSKARKKIQVLMNMVKSQKEAELIFDKLKKVAMKNIGSDLDLQLIGKVNQDSSVSKCTKQRLLFAKEAPSSTPGIDLQQVARKLGSSLEHNMLEKDSHRFGTFFKKILGQF